MDNKGKINHVFKLLGIVFILLAITVFAHSAEYRFDCTDPFNCSVKSYCQSIPGAVEGLLVGGGTAYSYANGPEPVDYSFSAIPGTNICSAVVQVTAFHNQNQSNERTTIYVNGTSLGTTSDNYCNGPSSQACTFCGIDQQNLGQTTLTLNEINTLTIEGHDSHAVVAVILNCVPQYNPNDCYYNSPPRIDPIPNQTIPYNSEIEFDLWNYISDYDDRLTDLDLTITTNNSIIDCQINDNRYLVCESSLSLGTTNITITAEDDCDSASRTFSITSRNNPPIISVPNREYSCSSNLHKIIDLRNYSVDESLNTADYNIIAQSNTTLLNCYIEDDYYVSCDVNNCSENYTQLRAEIRDIFGLIDTDDFNISLKNFAPEWKYMNDLCINESQNIYDLRNYASDLEDGNNLTFTIDQNNYSAIDCRINNNSMLYCDLKTNLKIPTLVTLTATDTGNKSTNKSIIINTNCSSKYEFSSEQKYFCLEECTSHSTQVKIKNESNERECFDFDTDYEGTLKVDLSNNNFCLNSGETTYITMSVNNCSADDDFYTIKLFDQEQNIQLYFDYEIGNCSNFDGFKIEEYDGKICQGEKRTFTVKVSNTTDEDKTIYLSAENQVILPYFSKEKIFVEANQTKKVDLTINAKNAPLGKHSIQLSGTSENYHIEKRLILEVQDCSNIKERNFIISAPNICYDVSKGQIFEGSFNVRRVNEECGQCSFAEKGISLKLFGMENELSHNKLFLTKGQEKKVYFTIKVPENAPAGINFLTIKGTELEDMPFDDEVGVVDDEQICLNVAGTSNSQINVRTQTKDIVWCDSEIFELEIINNGDFDETFNFSILNKPKGISVSFSPQTITIPKGSSKIVYVSITTTPDSEIKDNQFITIKLDGNISMETKIYFNVKPKASFQDIEILSNTQSIDMLANSEATYYIQLRNNSEKTFTDLKVTFENVPLDMNIEEKIIDELKLGEIIVLSGKIITGNISGEFVPVFVIEKNVVLNKREFNVNVQNNQFFAGLFGLTGTGLFSLGEIGSSVLLSVFLILLLVIIILGVVLTQEKTNESWVEAE